MDDDGDQQDEGCAWISSKKGYGSCEGCCNDEGDSHAVQRTEHGSEDTPISRLADLT